MATVGFCFCPCHSTRLGVVRALIHRGDDAGIAKAARMVERPDFDNPTWTNVHDVLEAAVACRTCIANHAPALSNKPRPPYKPPAKWRPEDDE